MYIKKYDGYESYADTFRWVWEDKLYLHNDNISILLDEDKYKMNKLGDHYRLSKDKKYLYEIDMYYEEFGHYYLWTAIDSITQPYYEKQQAIEERIAKYKAVDTNTIGRWGSMRLYTEQGAYFMHFISDVGYECEPVNVQKKADGITKITFLDGLVSALGYAELSPDSTMLIFHSRVAPNHPDTSYRVDDYDYSFWGDKYIFGFEELPPDE
ncbi:MAG: hypothetical protein LRY27_03065 [Chitinophagales bacterium]|nr:hypothetical protein [Chitinophagales bacterium]